MGQTQHPPFGCGPGLLYPAFVDAAPADCDIHSRPGIRASSGGNRDHATNSSSDWRDRGQNHRGPARGHLKERLWSLGLVLAIAVLLTASLFLSTGISAIGHLYAWLLPSNEVVFDGLNAIFSFIILTGLFAVVYKVLPGVAIEWRDVLLGAAVTSLLFTLGNIFLGLYLGRASFSSIYGAAASTVVLTLWVYYSGQIFFLGAEFTKAFAEIYGSHAS